MRSRAALFLVLPLLAGLSCVPPQHRLPGDEELPMPSELAAEATEVTYRSHDAILVSRRRPDDPVPPGGRVTVRIRRATPKRAEFDTLSVVVEDDGTTVLETTGDRSTVATICGANTWCNEQSFDVEKPVLGPLRVVVFDPRNGHRRVLDIDLAAN